MIRLLVATHSTKLSGAELALVRFLQLIDRDRFAIHVAVPDDGPVCQLLRDIAAGVTVHVVPASTSLTGLKKRGGNVSAWLAAPAHSVSLVKRTRSLIVREQIEIVLCWSIKSDFYAGLAARLCGRPSAWFVHDYVDAHYFPGWLMRVIGVVGRALPEVIMANSTASVDALARLGIPMDRLRVVYSPPAATSTVKSPSIRAELRLGPDVHLVTLAGRITPPKGQREFVEAAGRLVDRFPDVTFLLVGDSLFGQLDDAYRDAVIARLAGPEFRGRVRWLGARRDASTIIAQSDIAVMNSLWPEGFGNVAAEAMWARVPLVGTALGGMADLLVHEETGLVVAPGDVDALVAAISFLLTDPAAGRRLAERANHRVAQVQADANVRRLEDLLEIATRRRER